MEEDIRTRAPDLTWVARHVATAQLRKNQDGIQLAASKSKCRDCLTILAAGCTLHGIRSAQEYSPHPKSLVARPLDLSRLRVVLVAARNPLNIGAVARAMSNFGFSSLCLVNPFPPSFLEARSAVGASEILAGAKRFKTVAEAVADCHLVVGTSAVGKRDLQHPVRRPEYAARKIRDRMQSGNVALLFGSEKFGLSNRDLSHCHWLIRIPTREKNISMNLGQAAAVCLYELIRDAKFERSARQWEPATAAELERITTLLLEALQTSGFLDRRRVSDADERIRRLVRRLRLPKRDAVTWLGMLRQMLWKMNEGKEAAARDS